MIGITKAEQLKKNGTLKEKPFKSKAYLEWFHNQNFGCLVCGDNNIEAHHIMQGNRGRQDDLIVPLCPDHHRGKYSPHGFDATMFHATYPKDMQIDIANKLFGEWDESK